MSTKTEFAGYLRRDGRKGIRNVIVVAYLVECAHHVAREIVYPFRQDDVHLIGFSGDLYGERLRIYFVERLRDERKFRDVAD